MSRIATERRRHTPVFIVIPSFRCKYVRTVNAKIPIAYAMSLVGHSSPSNAATKYFAP